MSNLLFLRRSNEYRHAAVAAFRKAGEMPIGRERTAACELARGLIDLARTEAWLEGQTPQVRSINISPESREPALGVVGVGG